MEYYKSAFERMLVSRILVDCSIQNNAIPNDEVYHFINPITGI